MSDSSINVPQIGTDSVEAAIDFSTIERSDGTEVQRQRVVIGDDDGDLLSITDLVDRFDIGNELSLRILQELNEIKEILMLRG